MGFSLALMSTILTQINTSLVIGIKIYIINYYAESGGPFGFNIVSKNRVGSSCYISFSFLDVRGILVHVFFTRTVKLSSAFITKETFNPCAEILYSVVILIGLTIFTVKIDALTHSLEQECTWKWLEFHLINMQ